MLNVVERQRFAVNGAYFVIPRAKTEQPAQFGNRFDGVVLQDKVDGDGIVKVHPIGVLFGAFQAQWILGRQVS